MNIRKFKKEYKKHFSKYYINKKYGRKTIKVETLKYENKKIGFKFCYYNKKSNKYCKLIIYFN